MRRLMLPGCVKPTMSTTREGMCSSMRKVWSALTGAIQNRRQRRIIHKKLWAKYFVLSPGQALALLLPALAPTSLAGMAKA